MDWHPQRGTLHHTWGLTPPCTPGAWQGLVGSLQLGRMPSITQRPRSSSPGQADPARAWERGPRPQCWLGPSSRRALGRGRSGKTSGAGMSNKAREPSQLHPAAAPPPRPSLPAAPPGFKERGEPRTASPGLRAPGAWSRAGCGDGVPAPPRCPTAAPRAAGAALVLRAPTPASRPASRGDRADGNEAARASTPSLLAPGPLPASRSFYSHEPPRRLYPKREGPCAHSPALTGPGRVLLSK